MGFLGVGHVILNLMHNLGFLAGVGAALAWGSYIVPFKKSGSKNLIQFQALMGVGILISGMIFSLILNFPLELNTYGFISGILWAIANVISLVALSNLGLSRAVPLMSSIVIISSFIWGTMIFKEIPSGRVQASFGIALIILGVILVSTTAKSVSPNIKKGLIAAILAGLIWGSQLAPLKIGNLSTREFFFPSCLGIFATAALIALITKTRFKREALRESVLSGTIWNIGNLLSVVSISYIGLSKGQPISLSATLVAVLWGLFYFKEIKEIRKKLQVLIGATILVTGVIILGLA